MPERPDPSARFDDRADLYAKYRPSYPAEMYAFLIQETDLEGCDTVADLGSGTGILSGPFLERGSSVYAVEPNSRMRARAEAEHGTHPCFHSIDGKAEATGLGASTIDLAVAGQAFHWFDPAATRIELDRILKPGGHCALIWNRRLLGATQFLRAYEDFLDTWGTDYHTVSTTYENPEALEEVLGRDYLTRSFENSQALDEAGLHGRLLSSSYMPSAEDPSAQKMLLALSEMFERYQTDGQVRIDYSTDVFLALKS